MDTEFPTLEYPFPKGGGCFAPLPSLITTLREREREEQGIQGNLFSAPTIPSTTSFFCTNKYGAGSVVKFKAFQIL